MHPTPTTDTSTRSGCETVKGRSGKFLAAAEFMPEAKPIVILHGRGIP